MSRTGLEPATFCTSSSVGENNEDLTERFRDFLLVDFGRDRKTDYEHVYYVREFLRQCPRRVKATNVEDVREYLKILYSVSSATYKNKLSAFKLRALQVGAHSECQGKPLFFMCAADACLDAQCISEY